MSNKGLARRIVDIAAVRGVKSVRCDHTSVLRWLAGVERRTGCLRFDLFATLTGPTGSLEKAA
jgi:hypothetical protein